MRRPALDASERQWLRYVYVRDNPMGPHDEWWQHSAGCRQWFVVRRDTRTHEILGSAAPGEPMPQARADDAAPFACRTAESSIARESLPFEFDGARYEGFAGDTLASALLANGVHLVGRSFKYHRPRGILGAGVDEPNALVQLGRGARTEPNVRATTQELYDGLVASSQNRWPSLRFDIGAINNVASRLIPAGFYYKTFMWPPTPKWWLRYEHADPARRGHGRARASLPDPDRLRAPIRALRRAGDRRAGPRASPPPVPPAHAGARVMLCDENPSFGGSLVGASATIDGAAGRVVARRDHRRARRARRRHAAAADHGIRLLRRQSRRA